MENRTTVFYVDDNPKSSRLLTSVLEHSGFKVISKNDPIEALALGGGPWERRLASLAAGKQGRIDQG